MLPNGYIFLNDCIKSFTHTILTLFSHQLYKINMDYFDNKSLNPYLASP